MAPSPNFSQKLSSTLSQIFGFRSQWENPTPSEPNSKAKNPLDESFVKLGDTYLSLKNYESALNCYRDAIRINPLNAEAYNRLMLLPIKLSQSSQNKKITPNKLDDATLLQLTMNDVFRQTLVGGYIVFSKEVFALKEKGVNELLKMIQNLQTGYFENHSNSMRDYGVLLLDRTAYTWIINHCNSEPDDPSEYPVLIIMSRKEYRVYKELFPA